MTRIDDAVKVNESSLSPSYLCHHCCARLCVECGESAATVAGELHQTSLPLPIRSLYLSVPPRLAALLAFLFLFYFIFRKSGLAFPWLLCDSHAYTTQFRYKSLVTHPSPVTPNSGIYRVSHFSVGEVLHVFLFLQISLKCVDFLILFFVSFCWGVY